MVNSSFFVFVVILSMVNIWLYSASISDIDHYKKYQHKFYSFLFYTCKCHWIKQKTFLNYIYVGKVVKKFSKNIEIFLCEEWS